MSELESWRRNGQILRAVTQGRLIPGQSWRVIESERASGRRFSQQSLVGLLRMGCAVAGVRSRVRGHPRRDARSGNAILDGLIMTAVVTLVSSLSCASRQRGPISMWSCLALAELLGFYAVVRAYRFTGLAAGLGHIGLDILCYNLNPLCQNARSCPRGPSVCGRCSDSF